MLLKYGVPVSMAWNLWYLAPVIRKQANCKIEDSIHDTCMKRVTYMMLRLTPTIHCSKGACGTKLLPTTVLAYPVDCARVCFCHLLNTQHCCLCPNEGYLVFLEMPCVQFLQI